MGRVGIVLLNLGGPERIQDVGPFLYNLFADPEIIRLPLPVLQKPLAWLISSLRSSKSQEAYRSIGGVPPAAHYRSPGQGITKPAAPEGHGGHHLRGDALLAPIYRIGRCRHESR